MKKLFRQFFAPFAALIFLMFGSSYFTTFTSLYVYNRLASEPWVGIIQASFFAGYIFGALAAKQLLYRFTHVKTYLFMTLVYLGLIGLTLFEFNPYAWVICRFMMGLALAILYIIIESWIVIVSPTTKRGTALGFYMIGLYFSQSSSQLIIDLIQSNSLLPFVITLSLVAASIIPLFFARFNSINEQEISKLSTLHFLRSNPNGVIICLLAGCINGIFFSYTPLFAKNHELSVSLIMALTIGGGLAFQYPLGSLSDRFSRRKLFMWMGGIMALIATLMTQGISPYLLSFAFGGLAFALYPMSISYVAERFETEDLTALCSALLLTFSVGSIIGPLICALALKSYSINAIYLIVTIIAATIAITAIPMLEWKQKRASTRV